MNRTSTNAAARAAAALLGTAIQVVLCLVCVSGAQSSAQSTPPAQQPPAATGNRRIGAIKGIHGNEITLTPDSGPDVNVTVQPTTSIVRIAPGEKDLKNATPIQLQDLQIEDRILIGGKPSDDNLSLAASSIVVMKRADLDARHQQDLQDWQKRGVGGLVSAVDSSAGSVTISVVSFAGKKETVIHTSPATVIRRYALDSVKFDDARPSSLQEIHPGDQLRARGQRTPDGSGLAADEIVSGSFRNVAGTVNAVDAAASTLAVQDLLSKKTVIVKVTADSQLRRLPAEMAQRIAVRLKGAAMAQPGPTGSSATGSRQPAAPSGQAAASSPGGSESGFSHAGMSGHSGGAPDLQQMLSRMPAAALTDLHKGDAVMLVSTVGSAGTGTAIQLLSGVEPILQASPSAGQAMMLAPWSLGAPSADVGAP